LFKICGICGLFWCSFMLARVRSSQAFSSTDFEVTVDVCGGAYVPINVVVALKWCTNYLYYIY
jgi:hypothetical protein